MKGRHKNIFKDFDMVTNWVSESHPDFVDSQIFLKSLGSVNLCVLYVTFQILH